MALTGLEMALLSGLGGSLIKGVSGAIGASGAAEDLKLTEEQRRRLKELERMEAESAFGMSDQDRQVYGTQVMSPVQTAEREALARFGASQAVGDIGQGAAFRQQQALKQTSEAARAEAQRAVAERDAVVAQQQQQQLAMMRQQEMQRKAMERQAVMSLLGAAGEGLAQAGGIAAKMKFAEETYERDKPSKEDQEVISSTRNILLGSSEPNYKAVEGASMSGTGGQGMGGDGNRAVDAMMMYTDPYSFLGNPDFSTDRLIDDEIEKHFNDIYLSDRDFIAELLSEDAEAIPEQELQAPDLSNLRVVLEEELKDPVQFKLFDDDPIGFIGRFLNRKGINIRAGWKEKGFPGAVEGFLRPKGRKK